jgi:hypothetical protein
MSNNGYIIWSEEERIDLIKAYISVFEELCGLNHPRLWGHFTAVFNRTVRVNNNRDQLDVAAKWYEIKMEVVFFNDIYTNTEASRPNDSEDVLLEAAKESYQCLTNNGVFEHEECWKLMKDLPYF